MNCSKPPERPGAGTWEWNKEYSYETSIIYTCGPYGNFRNAEGQMYEELITECAWNKTWAPSVLDECTGTKKSSLDNPIIFLFNLSHILSNCAVSSQVHRNGLHTRWKQ